MRLPAAAYSATDRRHGHTIAKGADSTPSTLSVPADREGHYVLLQRGHLGRCAPPMHHDILIERRRIPPIRPHTQVPLTPGVAKMDRNHLTVAAVFAHRVNRLGGRPIYLEARIRFDPGTYALWGESSCNFGTSQSRECSFSL